MSYFGKQIFCNKGILFFRLHDCILLYTRKWCHAVMLVHLLYCWSKSNKMLNFIFAFVSFTFNTNLILESMCYMWNSTCPEFIHIKHKEAAVCISQVYGYKASTVDRGRLVDSSYTVSIISFLAMLTRRGFQSSKHRCVWSGPDYHYHVGITGYLRLKKGKWEAVLTHAVWCSSNWKESVLQYCEC